MIPPQYSQDPLLAPLFSPPCPSSLSRGPLHPGAVWEGTQKSGRVTYRVKVAFDTVTDSALTGVLSIAGLTPELEILSTFFEGEIIGDTVGFLTNRWGATEADDTRHWARFSSWHHVKSQTQRPNLTYAQVNKPFLFMRWKEQFVVPQADLKPQSIHGASFSGFYYICLDFNDPLTSLNAPSSLDSILPSRNLSTSPSRPFGITAPRSSQPPGSPPRSRYGQSLPLSRSNSYDPAKDEPADEAVTAPPGLAALQSSATIPIIIPPANNPRRTTTTPFSYAAAVRGFPSSIPASRTPSALPREIEDNALPKEFDTDSQDDAVSVSSSTSFPSPSLTEFARLAPAPIMITPLGTTLSDFPEPSSSSPPSGSWGGRRGNQRASSRMTAAVRSLDAMVLNEEDRTDARGGVGWSANWEERRGESALGLGGLGMSRDRRASAGEKDRVGKDEMGRIGEWRNATMTGYYFFRNSEPFQELSLHYVPQNRGGLPAFVMR